MTFVPISMPALMPALVAALIGWRMFRRVRRLIGRQPVRVTRLVMTAVFFPILLVLVSLSGLRDPLLFEAVAAGAAIGVGLALLGLRLTRFEVGRDGCFFVPNTVIGVAISVLFIGRLIYRVGVFYLSTGSFEPSSMRSFGTSPLTLAIFGVVAAYYTAFAIGILLWYRQARHEAMPAIVTPPAL